MPAVLDMNLLLPYSNRLGQRAASKIELAAAHEKITFGIGADILAFPVNQPGIANGTIIPPGFLRFVFVRR
jgi:hypothetical protein